MQLTRNSILAHPISTQLSLRLGGFFYPLRQSGFALPPHSSASSDFISTGMKYDRPNISVSPSRRKRFSPFSENNSTKPIDKLVKRMYNADNSFKRERSASHDCCIPQEPEQHDDVRGYVHVHVLRFVVRSPHRKLIGKARILGRGDLHDADRLFFMKIFSKEEGSMKCWSFRYGRMRDRMCCLSGTHL